MPMAPYTTVDFNNRISALIAVGTALAVPAAQMPAPTASNSDTHCLKWINNYNALHALPTYLSLDFGAFTSAINALAAKVP